jgi:hypothetical protein
MRTFKKTEFGKLWEGFKENRQAQKAGIRMS